LGGIQIYPAKVPELARNGTERQALILEALRERPHGVRELARLCGCSERTICNDLAALRAQGVRLVCERVSIWRWMSDRA